MSGGVDGEDGVRGGGREGEKKEREKERKRIENDE